MPSHQKNSSTVQTLFREVTVRLCGTLDLALGLQRVFDLLAAVFPLDDMRVNVLDAEMHAVRTIALANANEARNLIDAPIVLPLEAEVERELAGEALPDVRVVGRIGDDHATASIRDHYFADEVESSLLIMRLIIDGRRQGVLLLRATGEDRYTADHAELLKMLNEPFAIAVNNAVAHHALEQARETLLAENEALTEALHENPQEIVGAAFGLAEVMDLVGKVAPLDSPVLLLGETGVGKEVIADAIHRASPRADRPFVKLNCGAIPEALVDSELFGHEKGAFTGAVTRKAGRFERAHSGTLFLDEIGELPPDAQIRLLRVLQTKQIERVGGTEIIETDVRIIAATHRDLPALVDDGLFRKDLWYRIGVFPILIPPLRERKADIPALVHHFVERKCKEMGIYPPPALALGAMERLQAHAWPGNVRELQNVVERELIIRRGGELLFQGLGNGGRAVKGQRARSERDEPPVTLDAAVTEHIRRALRYAGGKVGGPNGAAQLLNVNASTLRNRMKRLGIPYGRQ